jgi:hypothetical protein
MVRRGNSVVVGGRHTDVAEPTLVTDAVEKGLVIFGEQ